MDPPIRTHWPKLAGVGMIEHRRDISGRVSVEQAFYIGSKGMLCATICAEATRGHWAIENGFHRTMDVTFREDDCRVRNGYGPQNFSALRKLFLSLRRKNSRYPKRSLRGRRQTADRNPAYCASLFGLAPLGSMRLPCHG